MKSGLNWRSWRMSFRWRRMPNSGWKSTSRPPRRTSIESCKQGRNRRKKNEDRFLNRLVRVKEELTGVIFLIPRGWVRNDWSSKRVESSAFLFQRACRIFFKCWKKGVSIFCDVQFIVHGIFIYRRDVTKWRGAMKSITIWNPANFVDGGKSWIETEYWWWYM